MRVVWIGLVCLALVRAVPLGAADVREVPVVVAVDEEFRKKLTGFRWDFYMDKLLDRASKRLKKQAHIAFKLEEVVEWESPDSLQTAGGLLRALEGRVGQRGGRVVVGLSDQKGMEDGSVLDYLGGYVLARVSEGEKDQAFWLARGFAGLLGALPLARADGLMGRVEDRDSGLKVDGENLKVVRLHRDRPFGAGGFPLPEGLLAEALSAYRALEARGADPGLLAIRQGLLLDARGEQAAAVAHFARGLLHLPAASGAVHELERIRAVVAGAPELPEARVARGWLDLMGGDPEAAGARFRAALEDGPELFEAHYGLGRIHAQRRAWDTAVLHFEAAARQQKEVPELYMELARAYLAANKPEGARWAAREAAQLAPSLAEAHSLLGQAYVVQQKVGEAIQACNRALKLDESNGLAYQVLSQAYIYTGRMDEAVEAGKKAVEQMPGSAEARYVLGNAYLSRESFKKAVEAYEGAVALDANYAKAHSNLALAYYNVGKRDLALKHAETARSLGFEQAQVIIDAISSETPGR